MPTDLTRATRLVVEKLYGSATSGDFDGVLSVIDDGVVVHEPPFLPFGGRYEGKDKFGALFQQIGEYLDVTRMMIDYIVVDGEKAFGVIRIPDLRTGQEVLIAEQSTVHNGLIDDMRIFYHDVQSMLSATLSVDSI